MSPGYTPLPVNQYFQYNPITGLEYFSGPCNFLVTTDNEHLDDLTDYGYQSLIEQWIEQVYEFGTAPIWYTVEPISRIFSNFNISLTKF